MLQEKDYADIHEDNWTGDYAIHYLEPFSYSVEESYRCTKEEARRELACRWGNFRNWYKLVFDCVPVDYMQRQFYVEYRERMYFVRHAE